MGKRALACSCDRYANGRRSSAEFEVAAEDRVLKIFAVFVRMRAYGGVSAAILAFLLGHQGILFVASPSRSSRTQCRILQPHGCKSLRSHMSTPHSRSCYQTWRAWSLCFEALTSH